MTVNKSKTVVTYYPRKTAEMILRRKLIRQTNHVWRGAYIPSLSTIFRGTWKINSRGPRRTAASVRQIGGVEAEPRDPIRLSDLRGRYCRCAEGYSGGYRPRSALNAVTRRRIATHAARTRGAVISIQFVSRQQMQLTSAAEPWQTRYERVVGTDIPRSRRISR